MLSRQTRSIVGESRQAKSFQMFFTFPPPLYEVLFVLLLILFPPSSRLVLGYWLRIRCYFFPVGLGPGQFFCFLGIVALNFSLTFVRGTSQTFLLQPKVFISVF